MTQEAKLDQRWMAKISKHPKTIRKFGDQTEREREREQFYGGKHTQPRGAEMREVCQKSKGNKKRGELTNGSIFFAVRPIYRTVSEVMSNI